MKYSAVILSLLISCGAPKNNIDVLMPDKPTDGMDDPKALIEIAAEMPSYSPPAPIMKDPLTLSDILSYTLAYQLTTRRSFAAAESAGYSYKSSLSAYYPTLVAAVNYLIDDLHYHPCSSGFCGTFHSYEDLISLSYLLLDFGGRDASVASAWHAFQATGYLYNQSIQNILIDALQSYFNYLEAFEIVNTNILNLETARTSYEVAKQLYDVKYVSVFDLEQLNTAVIQQETSLRTNEGNLQVAHGALAKAMGLQISIPFRTEKLNMEIFPKNLEEDIEKLMKAALNLKPSLASFKEEYLSRRADIKVAQSAAMPTLNLKATSSMIHYKEGPIRAINESTILFNLDIPLFQGFYFINQIRKSQANAEFACLNWKLEEQAAMLDVWSNYFNFLTAQDNVKNLQRLIDSADVAYRSALELYKLRFVGSQDLLSAQNNLASSLLLYVRNKIQIASSISQLAYSLGIIAPNLYEERNSNNTKPSNMESKLCESNALNDPCL